ncbi:hypothetical protein SRHO_G00173200 [Serrasalmus rhombeus]
MAKDGESEPRRSGEADGVGTPLRHGLRFSISISSHRTAILQLPASRRIGRRVQAVACRGLLLKASRRANVVMSGG